MAGRAPPGGGLHGVTTGPGAFETGGAPGVPQFGPAGAACPAGCELVFPGHCHAGPLCPADGLGFEAGFAAGLSDCF